jgi:hypothetical protein
MEWFAKHSAEYWGQWVAVKDGQLLGADPTFLDLREIVPNHHEAVITQIA